MDQQKYALLSSMQTSWEISFPRAHHSLSCFSLSEIRQLAAVICKAPRIFCRHYQVVRFEKIPSQKTENRSINLFLNNAAEMLITPRREDHRGQRARPHTADERNALQKGTSIAADQHLPLPPKARNVRSTVLRVSWASLILGEMPQRWSRAWAGASTEHPMHPPHLRALIVVSTRDANTPQPRAPPAGHQPRKKLESNWDRATCLWSGQLVIEGSECLHSYRLCIMAAQVHFYSAAR
jgi:hypothetical protein